MAHWAYGAVAALGGAGFVIFALSFVWPMIYDLDDFLVYARRYGIKERANSFTRDRDLPSARCLWHYEVVVHRGAVDALISALEDAEIPPYVELVVRRDLADDMVSLSFVTPRRRGRFGASAGHRMDRRIATFAARIDGDATIVRSPFYSVWPSNSIEALPPGWRR